MKLLDIFIYLGYLLLAINVIIYSIRVQTKNHSYRVLFLYLVYTSIIQILTEYFGQVYKQNLFMSHYYFIGQFIILSLFYFTLLKNSRIKKFIIINTLLVSLILTAILMPPGTNFNSFNLMEVVICSVPIVVYAVIYFFNSVNSQHREFLFVNSGIFIYLICSTLIFVTGNYVKDTETFWFKFIWVLNSFLYAIFLILFSIEWFKNFHNKEVSAN